MSDIQGAFWILMGVAAVAGWCVIEGFLWVLSHLTIGFAS